MVALTIGASAALYVASIHVAHYHDFSLSQLSMFSLFNKQNSIHVFS